MCIRDSMHGDHSLGIPSIIQTYSLNRRIEPLEIYGPKGIEEWILWSIQILKFIPSYPLIIRKVKEGTILEAREYSIKAARVHHSTETYAYSLEEKERPGRFNPEKARELGVPIRLWKLLQMGKEVKFGGKVVRPREVLSPPRRGRKIVISGDTRPCEALIKLAKGADVLVHEATYTEDKKELAEETLHSTAKEAAEIAKEAGVKLLVLIHFSARYQDPKPLLKEAREVFPETIGAYEGLALEV